MEHILNITNLSKQYDGFALKHINMSIPKGTIMGFVGENGAGKTTTIKLILNIINRSSGTITIFGKDNIKQEALVKEDIGVVLDEGFFYESFTPNDIDHVMKQMIKKWDTSLFKKYLKQFELPYKKAVKTYSKGMKMKLYIATALAHRPKLLILDEPTSGLDPIVRSEILDIFMDFIQDEEHSILFSTHITSDLDKIADYITLIHQGQIIFSKSKDSLFEEYGILKCGLQDFNTIDKKDYISFRKNKFGYEILVENKKLAQKKYPNFAIDTTNIEDIMLFYVRRNAQ